MSLPPNAPVHPMHFDRVYRTHCLNCQALLFFDLGCVRCNVPLQPGYQPIAHEGEPLPPPKNP